MQTASLRNYINDLLKSRIFLGRYLERRLTDKRIGYRDVVLISPAEVELKRDLKEALHKLQYKYSTHWIGISDSKAVGRTSGFYLWTKINNKPFGPFWFQIKDIRFRDMEVIVNLICVRHISDAFIEIEPILTGAVEKSNYNFSDRYGETAKNDEDGLKFLFTFVMHAIFTESTTFIHFLGNFTIALIREMLILIKISTPLLLGCLDFLSKIVGGFYILMTMFFKRYTQTTLSKRNIGYYK